MAAFTWKLNPGRYQKRITIIMVRTNAEESKTLVLLESGLSGLIWPDGASHPRSTADCFIFEHGFLFPQPQLLRSCPDHDLDILWICFISVRQLYSLSNNLPLNEMTACLSGCTTLKK